MFVSEISQYLPLREIIQELLKERGLNQLDIARLSNVSQSTLSNALLGKRNFSLEQVDKITDGLGFPKGALYPYYESEMYGPSGKVLPTKLCSFIRHCYYRNLDYIGRKYIKKLSDISNKSLSKLYLSLGEDLHKMGFVLDAIEIYRLVIGMELTRIVETPTLVLSYYRLFSALREMALEEAYDIAIMFSYTVDLMPSKSSTRFDDDSDDIRTDAIRKLISYFYVLEKWKKVIELCDKLAIFTKQKEDMINYGNSLVYKGRAAYYLGMNEMALQIIEDYINIEDKNGDFKRWGTANRYNVLIESGNVSLIPEYLTWLDRHVGEINASLPVILNACLVHDNINIMENIINAYIPIANKNFEASKKTPWDRRIRVRINFYLAHYLLKSNNIKDIPNIILNIAEESVRLKLSKYFSDLFPLILDVYHEFKDEEKQKLKDCIEQINKNTP
ncbi:helix-turn-helix domain-containing protein [Brevibacillus sp. NPDC003359]|uniref:helix-turn-helix domain-containing protein n=1 Tax=unclassified Brevibacillus TaxID=2684853 RepID=UPI0036CBDDE4